jgi:hypothetical protein
VLLVFIDEPKAIPGTFVSSDLSKYNLNT